jgi:hypothetical protein
MPESPQPPSSRTGWKARLAHAFAVEKPEEIDPTPQQREIIDRLCRGTVRRHLSMPALLFVRMSRPLNYVGASVLHFFEPLVKILVDTTPYNHFAAFLEHRGSVDYLCRRIEHFQKRKEDETADGRR